MPFIFYVNVAFSFGGNVGCFNCRDNRLASELNQFLIKLNYTVNFVLIMPI